jgi:acetyl-CoA synthetase
MATNDSHKITSMLKEARLFPPPEAFQKAALLNSKAEYERLWQASIDNPERFWGEQAGEHLTWFKKWDKVLDWDVENPHARWFEGGKINLSYNCLDRHLTTSKKDKAAIIWEGEPGDKRVLTYAELHREVCQFANVLIGLGIKAGDTVSIYMPLIPEMAVAMLACARIGALHSVIFGGFSSEAIADRNNDAKAKLMITADGGWRRGAVVALKQNVDVAMAKSTTVKKVVVVKRTGQDTAMQEGRDFWWHDLMKDASTTFEAPHLDSEHPLFILYTSGSTGRPKGIAHSTAGFLLGVAISFKYVFDLKDEDVFWCTADLGWVTGHSYVLYGPLANGATTIMYEGAPSQPDWGRFWDIIERYKISILYTAPTAIRAFVKAGDSWPKKHDLSSLRLLGSVGEPINPEAWMWYRDVIGGNRCPIVDTWWQTETGSIMITPLPGVTSTTPGSATLPFFGVEPEIVDKSGKPVGVNEGGYLVIKKPWPSMLRTIHGDDERYKRQYWSHVSGVYFTGDGARRDENGYYWIMGRIDDVINVSGHRLSTMEIESALVSYPSVAEAAVVGAPHDLKGEGIYCFVTPKTISTDKKLTAEETEEFKSNLMNHVVKQIGALARPESIRLTEGLPKTRSGKIMRRLLRDIAARRESTGDTTTLEDFSVMAKLREDEEA